MAQVGDRLAVRHVGAAVLARTSARPDSPASTPRSATHQTPGHAIPAPTATHVLTYPLEFTMESFISYTLLTLALFCGLAVASTSPWAQPARAGADLPADEPVPATRPSLLKAQRNLKASYLVVYALVMFADWLQGSYIFSLYHDQYGLSLHLVSLLFVLGFATAAVAAFAVGRWSVQGSVGTAPSIQEKANTFILQG